MSKTATITITWSVAGDEENGATKSIVLTNASSPDTVFNYPLTSGRNSVNVPSGAAYLLYEITSGTLTGLTYDSGTNVGGSLSTTSSGLIPVASGATVLYLNATTSGTVTLRGYFL